MRVQPPPVPLPKVEGAAFSGTHVPLIERYHERLPFSAGDPLVTLQEGSTPLLRAPLLSEMVGATVRLKLEGANPTGSFKDRGMTCAVSAAVREGAKAGLTARANERLVDIVTQVERGELRPDWSHCARHITASQCMG